MIRLLQYTVSGIALATLATFGAAAPTSRQERIPQVRFKYYRLTNGLRVILSQDRTAPIVAVSVTYDVGSRNERPGRTGFAHLFEHMMFQGSQNVGKGEHMMLIQEVGGTLNGSTSTDRTNYFETVPANQLDLALFLEADRMRSLDISQANLDNQRSVVQEERRQSYDNQPYGAMREALSELAYTKFPYRHSTIGSMEDLNAATLDDVREFFRTYYAPNNAALAVVGDFNETEARKKIERYFGDIPRGTPPQAVDADEPRNTGEQRKNMTDPLARMTRYEAAYRTVPGTDPDADALGMLGTILSRGRTSRLSRAITEKRLAVNVMAGGFPSRGPGLFSFSATLTPGADIKALEKALEDQIADVQANGVTDDEVAKAKAQARAAALGAGGGRGRRGGGGGFGLTSVQGRANALSQNAVYYDDPGRMNTALARAEAVTAADIRRVARKYLVKENRVVVICEPEEMPDDMFGYPYTPAEGR